MPDFVEIPDSTVDTQDHISMFEGNQQVFVVNGSTKKVVDFISTKLTLGALTTPPLRNDTLTQANTGAKLRVQFVNEAMTEIYGYKITDEDFNTTDNVSSDDIGDQTMDPATFVPTVVDAPTTPHCYDWTKHPSFTQDLPDRVYLACLYMGRAVLSGNPEDPNQWYMSRQNDPFDWDYGATDTQTPVSGETSLAGKCGDIIRALIPYNDDYLIFGCASSMWYMQGDPANGGSLQPLTETTGIYSSTSFCFDDSGNLYFLGNSGIFKCSVGGGVSKPVPITTVVLPRLRKDWDLDPEKYRVIMAYDKQRHGILITCTNLATGVNSNYWYDALTEGFFPEQYDAEAGAYSLLYFDADKEDESALLIGGQDGFIRYFDDEQKYDESYGSRSISSLILFPIVPAGEDAGSEGRITVFQFVLSGGTDEDADEATDSVVYEVYAGDCPKEVIDKAKAGTGYICTGTLTGPGRKYKIRRKIKGRSIGVLLKNTTLGHSWSIEQIEFDAQKSGGI